MSDDETGSAREDASGDGRSDGDGPGGGAPAETPYVESPIIMTTVRLIAPFVFTYGLFVMFHGADTPGGGFQGGVIVGAVVVMIGFAFGVEPAREWVANDVVVGTAVLGALTFVGVGVGSLLLGGTFLEYTAYEGFDDHASKYLIELVELAIGAIVAAVVIGLYFALAAGYDRVEPRTAEDDGPEPTPGGEA